MGKKYNSLMTIAFSVLHDEEDGSDITAHLIRERLTEIINCDDQEVCEACSFTTFENDKEIIYQRASQDG
jgi:threonine dehydratase